jgi:Family of unknown function (DUF6326)
MNGLGFTSLIRQDQKKEEQMTTTRKSFATIDPKVLLSTLWIVVMINMAYSLHIPEAFDEVARTAATTGTTIALLMLGGAIMVEIPIAMIVLSRVLQHTINRWINIIASIVTIVFVVGGAASYPHYIFIATIEVMCLLSIIWTAWQWHESKGHVAAAPDFV